MFSIGEHILYGTHGVCEISEKTHMAFSDCSHEYYVLTPVSDPKSVIYVPCDNELLVSQMRKILTESEISSLLKNIKLGSFEWIARDSERKEFCISTIRSGDRLAILYLIEMLWKHREETIREKKHFHVTDERFLHDAEKMIFEEFSFILGISKSDVPAYINKVISEKI